MNITTVIIDFYVLLSFVAGARISFSILTYFFHRDVSSGRRVLIYGANENGSIILHQLLSSDALDYVPVGFLDEATQLEGKHFDGFPVFGGHWHLPKVLRQHKVDEILFTNGTIPEEVFRRVKKSAQEFGVVLRRIQISFETISSDERSQAILNNSPENFSKTKIPADGYSRLVPSK